MPNNLISADNAVDDIFIHSGISSTITSTFAAPNSTCRGLAYDGANLLSGDKGSNTIYIHSGISSTITSTFAAPSTYFSGLTYDGTDLISGNSSPDKIYRHSGITSTISDSFAAPSGYPSGLAYDGANLISCDKNSDTIYIHSGISSTITSTFASPATDPQGLTYDGANLIDCSTAAPEKIYLHSGITSTISDSFASPNYDPIGLTYETANQAPTAPTSLEVDGKSAPTGANCISDFTPEFTAIYNDPDPGDQSNAIQIQVGTASGLSDMWDSGWLADSTITGNRCTAKTYAGAALSAETSYWWRCRFRDDDNAEGAWSSWQQFDMCAEEVGIGLQCVPGGPLPHRRPFTCAVWLPELEPGKNFPYQFPLLPFPSC